MTLPELLAKVEGASGPDREIDAQLWLEFTAGATRRTLHIKHPKGDYDIDETRISSGALVVVPSFTASLDSVVALIEAMGQDLGEVSITRYTRGDKYAWEGEVECRSVQSERGWAYRSAEGPTAALALLAAYIKAKMENPDDH